MLPRPRSPPPFRERPNGEGPLGWKSSRNQRRAQKKLQAVTWRARSLSTKDCSKRRHGSVRVRDARGTCCSRRDSGRTPAAATGGRAIVRADAAGQECHRGLPRRCCAWGWRRPDDALTWAISTPRTASPPRPPSTSSSMPTSASPRRARRAAEALERAAGLSPTIRSTGCASAEVWSVEGESLARGAGAAQRRRGACASGRDRRGRAGGERAEAMHPGAANADRPRGGSQARRPSGDAADCRRAEGVGR